VRFAGRGKGGSDCQVLSEELGGDSCDEPGFSLRPARLTSRDAWRSAVYISSRALFTPSLLSLVFFIIPRCISEL
jgi:hypothetical protein